MDGSGSEAYGSRIPEAREHVSQKPVAVFRQKTDNPLNNWYFSVSLFETSRTFQYQVNMQFEEIRGTDTLTLPNLGIVPEPVLRQGPDKYSCVIGFLDNEKKFREYKLVEVREGRTLRISTLKHYVATTYLSLAK